MDMHPTYNREMRPTNAQVRGNAALGAEPQYHDQLQSEHNIQPGVYQQSTQPAPPPTHPHHDMMGAQTQPTAATSSAGQRHQGFGSGQGNVVMGKLQQAAGMALSDNEMRARGLQRESQGTARIQEREAAKLEKSAAARRAEGASIDSSAPMGYSNPRI